MTKKEKLLGEVVTSITYCSEKTYNKLVDKKLIHFTIMFGKRITTYRKNITIVKLKEIISICREAKND